MDALLSEGAYTEDDYYSTPEDVRAELIEGQLYGMASPSRLHQEILGVLYASIYNYIHSKKLPCKVYPAPFAVKLSQDGKNIVEPDISVICDPGKLTDEGCSGAPDWIIEIVSPGNPGRDYITKLNLYSNVGVREYWIVDPRSKKVFVYRLEEKDLQVGTYTFSDKIKANIYDDFLIDLSGLNL